MDISKDYIWSYQDASIFRQLIKLEGTPEAIKYFASSCDQLTDYGYWFGLSTLWVSYTGFSDINLWKKLFSSTRARRKTSIMKPSELRSFNRLPYFVTVYRAHRENETDWIAYTLDRDIAFRFARERNVNCISEYKVKKRDILALFLRRGEKEVIVLDKSKLTFVRKIDLVNF